MADVFTLGGFSYVPLASGYRDSGGAPIPQACLFGVSDGTKVIPVGPGAPVPVSIVAGGSGTPTGSAGSPNTNVVTVQGIAGGISVPVSWTNQSVSLATGQTIALSAGSANIGSVAVNAGEAHVGEVGGNVAKFQAQFGAAATYTAGQVMSAPIQVTGMGRVANGTGLITSATLVLNVANTNQVDLVFFSSAPTGTYTAGSAFSIASADQTKVSKVIKLTDWTSLATAVSVGEPSPAPKFYRCDDATNTQSLWVVPVARGSITLAASTDATLTVRAARN